MSHVDEGALHAYLDGALDEHPTDEAERIRAHLDGCARCSARLEEERRVRSDAHTLLGLVSPQVEAPSFEELRAYVRRTRPERRRLSRLHRLGWAASVVLALGTGWMLRDGLVTSQGSVSAPERDMVVAPAGEARGDAAVTAEAEQLSIPAALGAGAAAPTSDGDLVSRMPAPLEAVVVSANSRTEEPSETVSVSRDAPSVPGRGADVLVEEAASAGGGPVTADLSVRDEPVETNADRPVTETISGDVTAEASVSDAADRVAGGADTTGGVVEAWKAQVSRGIVLNQATVPADSAAGGSAGEPVASGERQTIGRGGEDPPTILTSAARSREEMSRLAADERGAADTTAPRDPLLAVPGYEVLSVTNLGEGNTPWGVRVIQELEDGGVFEVIHLEPGVDPALLPEAGPDRAEVAAETESGRILVRAPLSVDALEVLLRSLLPGSP